MTRARPGGLGRPVRVCSRGRPPAALTAAAAVAAAAAEAPAADSGAGSQSLSLGRPGAGAAGPGPYASPAAPRHGGGNRPVSRCGAVQVAGAAGARLAPGSPARGPRRARGAEAPTGLIRRRLRPLRAGPRPAAGQVLVTAAGQATAVAVLTRWRVTQSPALAGCAGR